MSHINGIRAGLFNRTSCVNHVCVLLACVRVMCDYMHHYEWYVSMIPCVLCRNFKFVCVMLVCSSYLTGFGFARFTKLVFVWKFLFYLNSIKS